MAAKDYILLASGLGVFAVLSLAGITRSSIWFDESFTAYLIRFDFIGIAHYTSLDVHPPLYYWLLKLWSLMFGTSDLALRSMSVLFAVIALGLAFMLTRRLFGVRAAYWTLPLLAVMPFFVRYAQEARMYTLVAAIAFGATYALVRALEEGKRWKWWIIYGVLVSLGMWTHYFTALIWLSHWVWRLVEVYEPGLRYRALRKRYFTKQWVVAHVIAVGLYLPWLPFLVYQTVVVQSMGFWIPPIDPSTVPSYLTTLLYYLTSSETSPWVTIACIVTLLMAGAVMRMGYRAMDRPQQRNYRLLLIIASVPVALLLIASLPPLQSSFVDRYLLTAGITLILAVGVALAYLPSTKRLLRAGLASFMLIGMLYGVVNVYAFGNYNKFTGEQSAAKQVMQQVVQASTDHEPVIADSPWLFYDAVHYSTNDHTVYFIDANTQYRYGSLEMLRTNDMFKIKDLTGFAVAHQYIWYIDASKDAPVAPPDASWRSVKTFAINDPHTHKTAYHAVLYQTH